MGDAFSVPFILSCPALKDLKILKHIRTFPLSFQKGRHFLEYAKYPSLDKKRIIFTKMFTNFDIKDILFGQFCSDNDDNI